MKFLICAPRYNELSGGSIVLHKLCDSLNKQGHQALLWPINKPRFAGMDCLRYFTRLSVYYAVRLYRKPFLSPRGLVSPIAKTSDIDDSIVIYPETVEGNPLRATRYVRWLLYKPGFHNGRDQSFDRELYFYFTKAFDVDVGNAICGGRLTVFDYFTDIYNEENVGTREKICFLIRKGSMRDDLPVLNNQWVLDGLDHKKMAKAFKECKRCYFYDSYTFYSTYAALCGCVPVIVPIPGVSKEQWLPEEYLRYGLAYGESDIPNAMATRGNLIDRLKNDEEQSVEMICEFAEKVREFFQLPTTPH